MKVLMLLLMVCIACGYTQAVSLKDLNRAQVPLFPEEACSESRNAKDIQCESNVSCGHPKYRRHDGTCNNLDHPDWGSSNVPFKRLLTPSYEDGKNTPNTLTSPSGTYNGFTKPNPRVVAEEVLQKININTADKYSDLLIIWGQFFDHDIHLTSENHRACPTGCKQEAHCFPIQPALDKRLNSNECISMARSTRVCDKNPDSTREQLNVITSFLDASNLYGSTLQRANALRDLTTDNGFLKAIQTIQAENQVPKYLMPYTTKSQSKECSRFKRVKTDANGRCFFTGDLRANEHLGLVGLHTIWMREHNRIAGALKGINPHWNGNRLYQEARKIVGALMQHITYKHWLPKVVGDKGMKWLSDYSGHDSSVDASATNVFATAAFRFGHSFVSPKMFDGCHFQIATKTQWNIDQVLRTFYETPKSHDSHVQDFHDRQVVVHSMDIQRGRDHGLPGYIAWREFCRQAVPEDEHIYSSIPAETFDDLTDEITDAKTRANLQSLYDHPSNIDLIVAGMSEDRLDKGGMLGPTYTCLIVEQMRRLRDGDRFWYESSDVFTTNQLKELKKHSLPRVLCDSGDNLQVIPTDVFTESLSPEHYKPCFQIPSMNLAAWRDDDNIDDAC